MSDRHHNWATKALKAQVERELAQAAARQAKRMGCYLRVFWTVVILVGLAVLHYHGYLG